MVNEKIAKALRTAADNWEKDGQPGFLAPNVWGWREIAQILRELADGFENGNLPWWAKEVR